MTSFGRILLAGVPTWARLEGAEAHVLDAPPWRGGNLTGRKVPRDGSMLLCPVEPSKIFGIGKNYRSHALEMGGTVPAEPLVFQKSVSSLLGPSGTVLLPRESSRVDYEGELAIVIGKRVRRIPRSGALGAVFGVTAACDVTARDLQKSDGQWTRAKGFDTFCPLGPAVVTGLDPGSLRIELTVNGAVRQKGGTADMVFDVPALVAHVASFTTLEPGDVILTGTPDGVGPLEPGDRVVVSIEGVGDLEFATARENG